ncbi:MAG: Crp/Fnr family transcriptional regulator [Caldilineaceae bacterium]
MTRLDSSRLFRSYPRGGLIPTTPDLLLHVVEGVVAQMVIHIDGTEVLLGFYGPGQLLVPHPADSCYIHLQAHTDVTLQSLPWAEANRLPDLAEQLRARIWQQEAWAALQARPANEERLLGILSLLAEQFGLATADGTLVDLRITHQQLASAIGVTRPTVTRLINLLRRRRLLSTIGVGNQERFLLHQLPHATHL